MFTARVAHLNGYSSHHFQKSSTSLWMAMLTLSLGGTEGKSLPSE